MDKKWILRMTKITIEVLQNFLDERPAINISAFEREAELPRTKIKEFLKGNQNWSAFQEDRLLKVMIRYGYNQPKGLAALLHPE